jgi:hypothetical protein
MRRVDEELRAQVILTDRFVIYDGDGVDAGEDEVLCDFICEGFDADNEDIGFADAVSLSVPAHRDLSAL